MLNFTVQVWQVIKIHNYLTLIIHNKELIHISPLFINIFSLNHLWNSSKCDYNFILLNFIFLNVILIYLLTHILFSVSRTSILYKSKLITNMYPFTFMPVNKYKNTPFPRNFSYIAIVSSFFYFSISFYVFLFIKIS